MIYRALDPSGDYLLGAGPRAFLSGAQAVAQAVRTRLGLFRAEWWEDTAEGLPLFGGILGRPATPANLRAVDLLVRDRILGTPEVASIDSFVSGFQDRAYSAAVTIRTKSGETATISVAF